MLKSIYTRNTLTALRTRITKSLILHPLGEIECKYLMENLVFRITQRTVNITQPIHKLS